MRAARPLAAGLALCATLGALAGPAMALRLSMDRAGDCSLDFAERTCTRDKHCVRFGVLNCRRQSRHVVLPIAQRWQVDPGATQPTIEIHTEASRVHITVDPRRRASGEAEGYRDRLALDRRLAVADHSRESGLH